MPIKQPTIKNPPRLHNANGNNDSKELHTWLTTTASGQKILSSELEFLKQNTNQINGYFALQIGLPEIDMLVSTKMPYRYIINSDIYADLRFMPFASDSIDLIICPHALESINNYHYALQEFYRILAPNGKLIISCFNQTSWFGLFKRFIPFIRENSLINLNRLSEQLQTLNFSIERGKFFNYCPAFKSSQTLNKLEFMNKFGNRWLPTFANSFMIFATKEVVTPDLIKFKDLQTYATNTPYFAGAKLCNKN